MTIILCAMLLLAPLLEYGTGRVGAQESLPPAADFTAVDQFNRSFSLGDYAGDVIILHVTQLESPLCIECEEHMMSQIMELADLSGRNNPNITIITLNIRKNAYSEAGWEMARDWYGLNITWHWVEEFEPYPAAGLYQQYWELDGGFSNPTLILIDPEFRVAGVYNVYRMGSGEVDGVQTANSLEADAVSIISGDWGEFRGQMSEGITLAGMFVLGIITAISPCSIALLVVMISYIGGTADDNNPLDGRKRGFLMGTAFTLGMTLMFFLIGLLVAYVGIFIEMSAAFYLLAGILLAVLGINAIKPINLAGLYELIPGKRKLPDGEASKDRWIDRISKKSGILGAFLFGLLFTIAWAPCAISLVFPVIVLMLTRDFSLLTGGIMLGVFGLGHGIIIIPIAAATADVKARMGNKLVAAGKWIQPGFGIFIILLGIIFAMRFWGWNLW